MTPATNPSLYRIRVQGKWGLIDSAARVAVPPAFDWVDDFRDGFAHFILQGKHGYLDQTGGVAIPARFHVAGHFSDGLASVANGNGWGFVDRSGTIVIGPGFDYANDFVGRYARVVIGGRSHYVDRLGRVTSCSPCDWEIDFNDGCRPACVGGKWGFVDSGGHYVVNPEYNAVRSFREGLAAVQKGSKWGFVDVLGRQRTEVVFDDLGYFSEGLAPAKLATQWGFVDASGSWAIQPRYAAAREFGCGLAAIANDRGWPSRHRRYGFINGSGRLIIPAKFDNTWGSVDGLHIVDRGRTQHLIDRGSYSIASCSLTSSRRPLSVALRGLLREIVSTPRSLPGIGVEEDGMHLYLSAPRWLTESDETAAVGYLDRNDRWVWPLRS